MKVFGRDIIAQVLQDHAIDADELFSRSRNRVLTAAREDAAKRLASNGFNSSQIGRLLKRHRSTVLIYVDRDFRARKHTRSMDRSAFRYLEPATKAFVAETARLEETSPAVVIARWVNAWAHEELKARVAE